MQVTDAQIQRHMTLVYAVANRVTYRSALVDTDDLVSAGMDGLASALERIPEDDPRFSSYAWVSARNAMWDLLRKRKDSADCLSLDMVNEDYMPVSSPDIADDVVSAVEASRQVRKMMACLTPAQQELLWLHYVEGWTLQEIGNRHGVGKPTIHRRRELICKKLREVAHQ